MATWSVDGSRFIRFGIFEADLQSGELRRNGSKVKLQEQPFRLLVTLLERPGEVVSREELQAKLWPRDTFVDFDHSINAAIKRLREALSDEAENPRFIETLPRRGYRFIAPVSRPFDGTPTSSTRQTLEKEGTARNLSARELLSDLGGVQHAKQGRALWTTRLVLAFATLTLTAVVVIGIIVSKRSGGGVPNIVQRQVTANPVNDSVYSVAISGDGKEVAYSDLRGVHIRVIDTGEVYNVPLPQQFCFR